jgi:hypothetical protein
LISIALRSHFSVLVQTTEVPSLTRIQKAYVACLSLPTLQESHSQLHVLVILGFGSEAVLLLAFHTQVNSVGESEAKLFSLISGEEKSLEFGSVF